MRELGLEQARKFSPEQLGRETLACYAKALAPDNCVEPVKPHLALWTPLPPQRSGVADYSANILLGPLSRLYDVEVFVDDDVWPQLRSDRAYRVLHHSAFERRHSQNQFDVIVYQLGASALHVYMYSYLQDFPGVAVLHDLAWSYALYAGLCHPALRLNFLKSCVTRRARRA